MCWSLPLDLIRRWCGVAGIKAVPCFISSWGSCGAGPNVNYTLGINCCKVYISSIIHNPAGVRGLEAGAVGWAPVPSSARPSCCYFSPPFLPEDRNDMVGKAEYSSLCCPFVPLPSCRGRQGYFHDRATHLGISAISGRPWRGPGGMLALCFVPQNCCWALTV